MTNVPWKDPERRAHRLTPIETTAGQPRDAWSIHPVVSARRGSAESFDSPRARDRNFAAVSGN
jgi:hypothetical protein